MKNKIIVLILLSTSIVFWAKFANAATLYFTPSLGNIAVGDIFTVNVYVNTKNTAINNAEAIINFPPDLLSVTSVSRTGSIFSLWVEEPSFSNTAGTIIFNGGLPTPGFNGSAGKIASIVFRAKKVSEASLVFSSAAVRANDGLGTDILDSQGSAKFTLQEAAVPKVIEPTAGLPPTPLVKHYVKDKNNQVVFDHDSKNPEKWANSSYNKFTWEIPSDVNGISILLNDRPSSNPGSQSDGFFDNKVYEDLKDGIYYLHIRFINKSGAGPILHYKVLVDTVSPQAFNVELLGGEVTSNPQPRIKFSTSDTLSGIDRYEIKIDNDNWFSAKELNLLDSTYVLPLLTAGEHLIIVRAYDKAGNYTDAQVITVISAMAAPEITYYTENILSPEEKLILKGTALPRTKVKIYLNNEKRAPIVIETLSDGKGVWEVVYDEEIPSGTYEVFAKQILETGAESLPSASVYINVNSWLWKLMKWLKDMGIILILFINLLFLIVILVIAVYFFWHRFRMWRIKLRREVREAESAVASGFKKLKKEIKSGKTTSKVIKDLSEIEENIGKEIKDIEKR